MGNTFYFDWEVSLMEGLQKGMGAVGEAAAKALSVIGGETFTLLVLLTVLFCYKKEVGKRCGLMIIAVSMWFPMIKNIVLRLRPYMAHPDRIKALILAESDADAMDIVQQGYSFPSGHAAMAVTVYGSVAREVKKRWMWCVAILAPLLIGISRFAVGVHYPTDVLVGWVLGVVAIGFGALLEKKVAKEWMRYTILLVVTVPGIFWCTSRDYFSALGLLIAMVIVFPYEKKHIDFADTRNVWAMILRVVGALALYYAMNTVMKLPFDNAYLNSGELGANLIRSARYAIILFVIIGVYPRCFPLFEKVGRKKA